MGSFSSLPTVASIRSLNMKLLFLVCFLAVSPQFSNGKNYYLVNDEKSASEYVYGLFGLTNVVDKGVSGLNSIKDEIFGNKQKYDLGKNQITQQRPRYQSPTDQSALTNITMCYYLGDDIETSHLQYNDQWKYDSTNLNGRDLMVAVTRLKNTHLLTI